MKFVKKPPTTDEALSEKLKSDGWHRIKEPSNIAAAIACSIPFALLLGAISIWVIYILHPSLFGFLQGNTLSFTISLNFAVVLYIIGIFVWMMFHELLHAVFIPRFLKSDRTFWGFNGIFGFVSTTEPLKKGRFIAISLMPFVLLSVLLPVVLYVFRWLNGYTAFLCILNAAGSCVDFLNVWLIAFQVPNGRMIINNGFETYYSAA